MAVLSLALVIGIVTQDIFIKYLKNGSELKIEGAQEIGLDWEKQPFVKSTVVKVLGDKGECPAEYPDEMVYDVWNGLQDACLCQPGGPQSTTRDGTCKGKAANSNFCMSSRAFIPIIRNVINGYMVCGQRAGANFLQAVRPRGTDGNYACPTGYAACGSDTVFTDQLQDFVICTQDKDDCPITSMNLSWDEDQDPPLIAIPSYEPNNLPLLHFSWSTATPCFNINQVPLETQGQLLQEYSYSTEGCTLNEFTQVIYNDDFKEVAGDLEVTLGSLEQENFITEILDDIVNKNIDSQRRALDTRKFNRMRLYQKPVISWKLECESSPDESAHFTRQEAYDLMYKKTLNTQAANLKPTMFYGPLGIQIISGIMILMAIVIALQSLCRHKDPMLMITACSTNNGAFICASTCLTALLFFYLLLFAEALSETNLDIDFVHDKVEKVNACVDIKHQIPTKKLEETLETEQQEVYEYVVILLTIYISGYCFFIMPTSICLFRMKK